MYSNFTGRTAPLLVFSSLALLLGWRYCSPFFGQKVPMPKGGGESNCRTDLDCSDLSVQIVLDPLNVSPDCSVDNACGGGDNFKQLFYRVRLKYSSTNANDDFEFNLDYESIRVKIELSVDGAGPVLYSHIDETVTESCYRNGPGANWGNTNNNNYNVAVFEPEAYTVTLDFLDDIVNEDCGGDLIHFSPGTCLPNTPGVYCAYADLYTVAVNAYPGEEIQVTCKEISIKAAGFGNTVCNPSCNYEPNSAVTVSLPAAPTAGPNSALQVRLKDPVTAANGKGGCDVELEVANTGNDDASVYYMEFVAKVSVNQTMQPIEVTTSHTYSTFTDGSDTYIRFVVIGFVPVLDNSAVSLGKITVNPPVLQNQGWSAAVVLTDATKARLQAGIYPSEPVICSRLPLNTEAETCGAGGDPDCGSLPVAFKVWPPENVSANCPSAKKVKVGLISTSSSVTTIDVRRFAFELTFDLGNGAAIDGADTNPTQSSDRDLCVGTETSGCYSFLGSLESDCWKQEGDNVFQYCFDVSNAQDPQKLDISGDGAYLEVLFNAAGCINGVTVNRLALDLDGSTALCIPNIEAISSPYSICVPQVEVLVATEANEGVDGVDVTLKQLPTQSCSANTCADELQTTEAAGPLGEPGLVSFCPCEQCDEFRIVPEKDNDPLNGVSTFDLVLINKHILGLDPLDSPYKMIAADANSSRSITTFDIVELRKLILGIYTDLPNNTSWRFVDGAYSFPNPSNPFSELFPEDVTVDMSGSGFQEVNFVAVKVGDVNGNAVTNLLPNPATTIAVPGLAGVQAGNTVTVPVVYTGAESLEAFQLGLRFDPARLRLIGPTPGDLPNFNGGNFGLTRAAQGEIRALWFADPTDLGEKLEPGAVMFYLTFRVESVPVESSAAASPPLVIDGTVLRNAAWKPNGREFSVRMGEAAEQRLVETPGASSPLWAVCHPNPGPGEARFTVRSARAGRSRLIVFDAAGSRVSMQELTLTAGEQTLGAPDTAALPAGVYVWKLLTPWAKTQGHWVKQ